MLTRLPFRGNTAVADYATPEPERRRSIAFNSYDLRRLPSFYAPPPPLMRSSPLDA